MRIATAIIGGLIIGYLGSVLFKEPIEGILFTILFGLMWGNAVGTFKS